MSTDRYSLCRQNEQVIGYMRLRLSIVSSSSRWAPFVDNMESQVGKSCVLRRLMLLRSPLTTSNSRD